MSLLLQEGVLAWLAVLFLGGSSTLAVLQLLRERAGLGQLARWCAGVGGYFLLLSLTARGVQIRGWPFSSTYEAVLLTAAALALFSALGLPRRLTGLGGICAGLSAMLMVVLALLLTPAGARVPQPPPPALGGIWFPLHAVTTAVGYGGLVLAGCAGLLRLLLAGPAGGEASSRVNGSPDAAGSLRASLESLARRGLSWGYPWLTLGMALGALWGWLAWGHYWSWTVKEVMTLLTWGLFTLAFHTRRLKGWHGRPHAAILAAGLLVLLLTLLAAEALASRLLPTMRYIF